MTIAPLQIPVVETERLILRGWREEDIPAIIAITTDEEAARFIGGATPDWQAFRTMCSFIGHWQIRGFGFFAVEEKQSQSCIGWCGMWKPAGWPDNELGYSFKKSHWRKGFATEAASASLRFAYETIGWKSAISCIDEGNTGSEGVAKKLGASLEQRDVQVNDFTANVWRHLPPEQFLARMA